MLPALIAGSSHNPSIAACDPPTQAPAIFLQDISPRALLRVVMSVLVMPNGLDQGRSPGSAGHSKHGREDTTAMVPVTREAGLRVEVWPSFYCSRLEHLSKQY